MAYDYESLCKLLKCGQKASLVRTLKARGIRWSLDKDGKPWTTEAELDRAISAARRTRTFTKPPCRKKTSPYLPASESSMDRGTTSKSTNGKSYAG